MRKLTLSAALAASLMPTALPAFAADNDVDAVKREIQNMRQTYESRIADLEAKLNKMEQSRTAVPTPTAQAAPAAPTGTASSDNSFNPAIGLILNGRFQAFSQDSSTFAGFAVGEEGERGRDGFAIDESEINFSANVDNAFAGSLTAAIVREGGEDKIELEEAYIKTLPGIGLPNGINLKAGRAFWTFGSLNEKHSHSDDFADRPLPYRAFLNNTFNDDGVEASWVLPTDFYSEIGGGVFRGDDYPFGSGDGGKVANWSTYARVGGDIGSNQTWRLGGYALRGKPEGRMTNEDAVIFAGDSNLYGTDLRYTWAPTGNARAQELALQGEYFWRSEDGTYNDTNLGLGPLAYDESSSGWYAQAVYKFHPEWRVGLRYSMLSAPDVPTALVGSAVDPNGHDPKAASVMVDWSNSEFSRVRLQFNRESLSKGSTTDNQIILQYIMSIGAHGAHAY